MTSKIDFNEWFDINKKEHLEAYEYLNNTGSWPKGFIPDNVEMSISWNPVLHYRMAFAYVELKLHS